MGSLFSSKSRDSECFPVGNGVCTAFSVEKLPETAVKAWKRCFLTELQSVPIVDFFPLVARVTV